MLAPCATAFYVLFTAVLWSLGYGQGSGFSPLSGLFASYQSGKALPSSDGGGGFISVSQQSFTDQTCNEFIPIGKCICSALLRYSSPFLLQLGKFPRFACYQFKRQPDAGKPRQSLHFEKRKVCAYGYPSRFQRLDGRELCSPRCCEQHTAASNQSIRPKRLYLQLLQSCKAGWLQCCAHIWPWEQLLLLPSDSTR